MNAESDKPPKAKLVDVGFYVHGVRSDWLDTPERAKRLMDFAFSLQLEAQADGTLDRARSE